MDSVNPQANSQPILATLGVKFYRYKGLVRRFWWMFALTISAGVAYELYYLATKPQLYESSSRIVIREELVKDQPGGFRDFTGNFIGTIVEQLKGPTVLERAYKRVALEAPQLSGTVDINPSVAPRTSVFTVSGVGTHPEFTQRYVDAVVTELFAIRGEQRSGIKSEVTGQLGDQVTTMKKELETQKGKLQEFIVANNMAFWTEQGKTAAVFLSGLKNQQASLQNEQQRLENLSPDQLLSLPPAQAPAPKAAGGQQLPGQSQTSQPAFNGELYTQYLQKTQELSQRQAELEERATIWKPKHPRLQLLRTEVERVQRNLEVIKSQNAEATANRIVAIKAELRSLEKSIATWDAKVLEASRKDAEYQTLQSDVGRTQSQIEKLLGSVSNIVSGTGSDPDPLVVMQKASTAVAVSKGVAKHIAMGFFGGLLLGIIILLLINRMDDRLSSSSELLAQFSEPILAQIPDVAGSRIKAGLPLLAAEDERFSYAEAFRSLRSSLVFMPDQTEMRALLVTSAIPNEGKSTIASNLAITMAASGARVLLVDADLRRGDLGELFQLDSEIGLSNILRGEVKWKEAVQETRIPTLSIITRGPVTNQSGELLLKPEVAGLLDEFRESYDLAIFNTAPILAADDTPTLAPNFDGTLMVVRAQFTSARLTRSALDSLYQRQVNVLGLVLNCVDTEMPDYYHYRYPKYYAA